MLGVVYTHVDRQLLVNDHEFGSGSIALELLTASATLFFYPAVISTNNKGIRVAMWFSTQLGVVGLALIGADTCSTDVSGWL